MPKVARIIPTSAQVVSQFLRHFEPIGIAPAEHNCEKGELRLALDHSCKIHDWKRRWHQFKLNSEVMVRKERLELSHR